jgi:hypothetical protein
MFIFIYDQLGTKIFAADVSEQEADNILDNEVKRLKDEGVCPSLLTGMKCPVAINVIRTD